MDVLSLIKTPNMTFVSTNLLQLNTGKLVINDVGMNMFGVIYG